ncbi:GntR family transcriptional regulator [Kaistia geumhonensis]|uniref:DNA-binding GntR family transcriptional regulator n=1 Tax=Kaistia geumhonensis TaxID=410839 RepID=A0ABU0M7B5_9HYPH|nr:GntR family transcriptional regulator [Kaistia geumhonensis]MCX5477927.1 GntR family transcriptional regulator [Kaistia geumhonensis]MDQ0516860.1 DNA-binding GntR family transcriptional regulator [Kaistia geumhonensis]
MWETEQRAVRPRSTALNVYELLRSEIVLGVLKPLEPIREQAIAERLAISRTPVREALLRLADLGLVDIYPQSGTVVAPIRVAKVRAAQLIREAVEVEVARRATRAAAPDDIDALASIVEEQAFAAGRQDTRRFYELDEVFHRRIFAAADCLAVADELEDVKVHLNRMRFVTVNWPNRPGTILDQHGGIVAGMRARDEAAVAAVMTLHLRTILDALEAIDGAPGPGRKEAMRAAMPAM